MKNSKRRNIEVFNLAFLDVISCGFGAIILLLILLLALEPQTVRRITSDLRADITRTEGARESLLGESRKVRQELAEIEQTVSDKQAQLAQLKEQLASARARSAAAQAEAEEQERIEGENEAVLQTLSAEMARLLAQESYDPPDRNSLIGGIPVDSEYIIFIIDTSGSMLKVAWPMVVRKVEEVLSVYPKVKGVQVLDDMGRYMFKTYIGRWIPDTPARRKSVIKRLRTWRSFSNSSPVEGILSAVKQFADTDGRISLYVFGDDFASGNMDRVLSEVARINKRDASGALKVRIHAFGFPVLFLHPRGEENRIRFAHLMRLLAEQNAGSFVGLTSVQ